MADAAAPTVTKPKSKTKPALLSKWPPKRIDDVFKPSKADVAEGFVFRPPEPTMTSTAYRWDTGVPSVEEARYARRFFEGYPVRFLWAADEFATMPDGAVPEVAFLGRSNVGKSSILNALMHAKDMARTSSKPGRTRKMNAFSVGGARLTVLDMPGYGHGSHSSWGMEIMSYLRSRKQFRRAFLLIDAMHGVKELDRMIISSFAQMGIPYQLVLSKVDRLEDTRGKKKVGLSEMFMEVQGAMRRDGGHAGLGEILATSTQPVKTGVGDLRWAVLRAAGLEGKRSLCCAARNSSSDGSGSTLVRFLPFFAAGAPYFASRLSKKPVIRPCRSVWRLRINAASGWFFLLVVNLLDIRLLGAEELVVDAELFRVFFRLLAFLLGVLAALLAGFFGLVDVGLVRLDFAGFDGGVDDLAEAVFVGDRVGEHDVFEEGVHVAFDVLEDGEQVCAFLVRAFLISSQPVPQILSIMIPQCLLELGQGVAADDVRPHFAVEALPVKAIFENVAGDALVRAAGPVVPLAPGFIAEDGVREGDLLEFGVRGCLVFGGGLVGVGFERELAVGGADFGVGGGGGDTENVVGVDVVGRGVDGYLVG
ncbi:hypothetical protein Dda_5414 [Drechslerella dactyloides]|uniref:GTP-binding protein 8 n=1 Tax=Drechslerella dactyloides TaxID=74499 RepID=A0AAD6IW16_DREDA|nr:hypothetical protein Dda_5414 [Drechslerella dactyloides]